MKITKQTHFALETASRLAARRDEFLRLPAPPAMTGSFSPAVPAKIHRETRHTMPSRCFCHFGVAAAEIFFGEMLTTLCVHEILSIS